MSRRRKDAVSPKTLQYPQSEGIFKIQSFSLKSQEFMPHIRDPNQRDKHQREKAPKCLTYVQKTQKATGNWDTAIKGLALEVLTLGPWTKAADWKAPMPYVKEINLQILKCLLEEQHLLGLS